VRLNELLASEECHKEAMAYEALQLAQSQVRRHIKALNFQKATKVASSRRILLEARHLSTPQRLRPSPRRNPTIRFCCFE
jgi:hypothetical protein